MKKISGLVTLLILIANSVYAQQKPVDLRELTTSAAFHLLGNVKTIRWEMVDFSEEPDKKGKYTESRIYLLTLTFDKDGKLISNDRPFTGNMGCTFIGKQIPVYDEKGDLIEEVTYDTWGDFRSRTTFAYDANHNKIEEACYGPKGLSLVRKYNPSGQVIEEWVSGEPGSDYKKIYLYSENGDPTEELTYSATGALKKKEIRTIERDEAGNLIKDVSWECSPEDDRRPCKPVSAIYFTITYFHI